VDFGPPVVHIRKQKVTRHKASNISLIAAGELGGGGKRRPIFLNRPQFIAKDFKEFIRISGMTRPNLAVYPQSNGKIERWHKSLKGECIRPGTPLSLDDAWRLVQG
jgi:transposase InsO family protein